MNNKANEHLKENLTLDIKRYTRKLEWTMEDIRILYLLFLVFKSLNTNKDKIIVKESFQNIYYYIMIAFHRDKCLHEFIV